MGKENKDNAVLFLEHMCEEGVPFSEVQKQLGTFVAVLFFLRSFEVFLKDKSATEI